MVTSDPEGPKQQEPLSRIEREVLEILEQTEGEKPPVTDLVRWKAERQRRERQLQLQSLGGQLRERFTPGLLLVFGILLGIMAYVSRHTSEFVSRSFAVAALICLILPFIIHWRTPKGISSGPKTWRGRDIEIERRGANPIDEIKRWWNQRR
ncbi:MAG: hypothetical protein IT334_11795 [Thermomicrobiales bacterium]|nr:hypothetical protein [Thermomicrobiales bacterium]